MLNKNILCICEGGLANRIAHLNSCSVLSKELNRNLFVLWERNRRCNINLSDLTNKFYTLGNIENLTETNIYGSRESIDTSIRLYKSALLKHLYKISRFNIKEFDFTIFNNSQEFICTSSNWFLPDYLARKYEVDLSLDQFFSSTNPIINNTVNKLTSKLNIRDLNGYHVRLTDFAVNKSNQDKLFSKIKEIDKPTFLVSDDRSFLEKSSEMNPKIIVRIASDYPKKNNQFTGWRDNIYTSPTATIEGIIDMILLSRTKEIFSYQKSTFSLLARRLNLLRK
ncbi:hypothetical protein CL656_06840 [bacterium]|nr:hypothetical protein [bacterium]|tara:strand:- start:3807 stop:4649 length:843 start_codon:yes stop_codon:yes gene_type:complete